MQFYYQLSTHVQFLKDNNTNSDSFVNSQNLNPHKIVMLQYLFNLCIRSFNFIASCSFSSSVMVSRGEGPSLITPPVISSTLHTSGRVTCKATHTHIVYRVVRLLPHQFFMRYYTIHVISIVLKSMWTINWSQ